MYVAAEAYNLTFWTITDFYSADNVSQIVNLKAKW